MNSINLLNTIRRKIDYKITLNKNADINGLLKLDEVTRKRLQKELLGIYKDVHAVCEQYGLTAFLLGGSALGAVRHHGFIPWDDDLDIGMTRDDYEKFKMIFRKELSGKYILNAPNYSRIPKARFPRIHKKGTLLREITDLSKPEDCGIALDLFIIEDVPENGIVRNCKGYSCNFLEFVSSQVFMIYNMDDNVKSFYKQADRWSFRMRWMVGRFFSWAKPADWFHAVDKAVRYPKRTKLVNIPTGRKHYFGEILKRSDVFPPRYVDFCDIKAPVFYQVESYLRNLYGDNYMQLPPIEEREKHFIVELKF